MSATAFQRARREAAATMRVAVETAQLQEIEYTVTDLKAMCNEKGIEYKTKATKAELMTLLGM